MRRPRPILALAALALAPAAAAAPAIPERPVVLKRLIVGGEPIDYDGAWSRIVGLTTTGVSSVSVRVAPLIRAAERDRLAADRKVWAATPEPGAAFVAVIYLADPKAQADEFETKCGVPNPPPANAPIKRVYDGPCPHGWVHRRYVETLAD
ncbi:MAG: hypothetical protein IPL88_15950 [Rhizobiales bacterium]|nr:hypothetical protein [Hyphomicrobiales bacterium]